MLGGSDAPVCADGVCGPVSDPEGEEAAVDDAAVRYAIVGYGGAGRGIHARLLAEVGSPVTAVVVRDPQRQADAGADWPEASIFEDIAALLARRELFDVVVIATPSHLHAEHAALVAAAGVPFVLDKPIATSAAQAREIVATAAEHGTPFTVFQNRRWDPEQLTLREVLEAGELGAVHTFDRHWERFRPQPQQRWKELDLAGGGLLLDLGPHLVDSATQLFGPVVAVYAELRNLSTPTVDDVFLTLHHAAPGQGSDDAGEGPDGAAAGEPRAAAASPAAGGVISRLWAGSLVGAPGPRTRVLGRAGAYVVTTFENDASPFEVCDDAAPPGTLGWITRGRERTPVPVAAGGHGDFYRAVARWVTGAGPVPVDPLDAVRTAEVLDAALVSAAEGRLVRV